MRYKYYITAEVQKVLDKRNLASDIQSKLKNYLASDSPLRGSSIMANVIISKIDNHSGLRFVWFQIIRRDVCIYVLRRIYRHDEYTKKLNEGTKQIWVDKHQLKSNELEELNTIFAQFFKEEKRDFLPEEFRKYEESRAFDKDRDIIFYEMPLWSDGIKKVPKDYWSSIQDALSEKIFSSDRNIDVFMFYTTYKYTITYRYGDINSIDKSDVYLLQIVEGNEPNLEELIERKYDCEDVKDLQNISSKCYPDYYTYDYDFWKTIEEDDNKANLALSEEEIKVLQTVKFPFFVSGLAGSGKSLILYHLYANIYKYVAKEHPTHNMLFLSYNDMLVEDARSSVRSILSYDKANSNFNNSYFEDKENLQHFNRTFVPFRNFLKNEFLDERSIGLFSEEKHITYEKFRDIYQKDYKKGGKRLSPSILWSVIRTFIKGRKIDYFTPNDYKSDEIARGDRTVDDNVYEEAYKIWDTWYRHYYERGDGWDDLDLVRYVLTNGDLQNVFHNYSVIFCDEAQDFTKLEIDLILSLSKHSEYKLSLHPEDKRIPIAFAGDPNQTINPTGFRWAGTRAIFNKSFEDSLDTYPELDLPELSKNYRSQLGIVKFANTIQSIRYKYFDETSKDRKLQSVREEPKGENMDALKYVGFYSFDKDKDTIIKILDKANIITSGDGSEGDLRLFPEIQDKKVKLKTAMGTKGLEYTAVMLLNFSTDPAYKLFQKILNDEELSDDSERFDLAYFFTKLYIAISRAKEQLFIVDTDESYELFWKYFTDENLWKQLIGRFIHDEEKRKLVGHITIGDIKTLPQRLSELYDPEENGRQEFEKAKSNKSISGMEDAKSYFQEAGLTRLADECDAYIFLYGAQYLKAGDKFLSLNKEQEALNAYWKGECWEKLFSLIQKRNSVSSYDYDNIRLIASQFMTGDCGVAEFLQLLIDNIDSFQDAIVSYLDDQKQWSSILDKVKKELLIVDKVNITISLTKNLDTLSRFIKWYERGLASIRAKLYFTRAEFINYGVGKKDAGFRTDGYEQAISIWEETGDVNNNIEYFKSKKLTSKTTSEEIVWMSFLKETKEIVSLYGGYEWVPKLSEEAANIVFGCLISYDYNKAIDYPYPSNKLSKWQSLYSHDRKRFLVNVILDDFSMEKFYFLSDKVQNEEVTVFEERLPNAVYEAIFSLNNVDTNKVPYWTYFITDLKNQDGDIVLKKKANRFTLLEGLSNLIQNNNYSKELASCFLELLFDDEFDSKRAEKFNGTIRSLFSKDLFFKEDFRGSTGKNKYFTSYAELGNDELDQIKNNIRKYVTDHFKSNSFKKIFTNTIDDSKAFFKAFEISVAYKGTTPDYQSICNLYKQLINDKRFALIKDWMKQRLEFNQFLDDAILNRASYSKFAKAISDFGMSINAVVEGFSHEDASAFVAYVNTIDEDYSFDAMFASSLLIYRHHIRKEDLKPYCIVKDLAAKLPDSIDMAIVKVLSDKKRVDEYAIKLLTYTWESLYDHTFVANHYDKLVVNKRLTHLHVLTEYLKKRALLHYSYLKDGLFEDKQDEYGISMSKSYLPSTYPKIEKKSKGGNDIGTFAPPVTRLPIEDKDKSQETKKQTKNASQDKKERKRGGSTDNVIDPTKKKAIIDAKSKGLTDELIMQLTGLSLDDIKKL